MERPQAPLAGDTAPAPASPSPRSARRVRRGDRRVQPSRAPRHRLLLASTAALALGLVGVLLLNTVISQGAFRQFDLEVDLIYLAEEVEGLSRDVQQAEAPIEVERRARALGMVPAAAPVFLRLSDGAVLGEPVPAPEPTGPVDFQGAPGLLPTPGPRLAGTRPDSTPAATVAPIPAATSADPGAAASPSPAATSADPAVAGTGIDPALDPATGLEDPAAATDGEPAVTPSPTPQVTP